MGHLKCIMFVMVMIVISSSCCISKVSMEKCKMKEVEFTVVSKNCYYINIVFSHYTSKQLRENLVKKLIVYKIPSINNKEIQVQEYLGKLYNQYKYEVKIE